MQKRILTRGIIVGVTIVFFFGWLWHSSILQERTEIIFLAVGEGDAILITQGSHQTLIDGGRDGKELLYRLGKYVPFWDRHIEVVMVTHPDADHIGGLPALAKRYWIGMVLDTGVASDTESFALWKREQERSRSQHRKIIAGTHIKYPGGGELSVEYPKSALPETMSDTNEGSIVSRFSFGESDFLLTGDLPDEEMYLSGIREAEVLKVAHHGSKFSTSDAFLDLVRPREAVISVGDNTYGHPDGGVLSRLAEHGVYVRRTDADGDVRYRCDAESKGCRYLP